MKNGVATFTISSKPFYPFKLDLYIENHDKVSNNQIAVTFGKSDDQFSFRNEASLAS
ncbi:hypothetical protein FACS1894166_01350 [Bacilli bacterium]|nr:hypothetical protein FACS1894166_01350 [Bacilli bacterium]